MGRPKKRTRQRRCQPAGGALQSPGSGQACLLLLLAAFLWGTGNVANKTVLADVSPISAVFLRSIIAALALLWPVWRETTRATETGTLGSGWLRSVAPGSLMFALALVTQQWGYRTATVTNASFLVNASCVLTPLLGVLIWRDRLQARTVVSAGLALAGALAMSGAWRSLTAMNPGDALCLVSALFYALWIILIGRHLERFATPAATTLALCLCAAALSAPFAVVAGQGQVQDWWGAMPEALYLGLFSTAGAFLLTAAAQTRVSASTAAIIVSAESLFGGAAGMLVLGERPDPAALAGAALILLAIGIMALRPEPATGGSVKAAGATP
jgi:drug/metabolite transporter (DMT)-like permease